MKILRVYGRCNLQNFRKARLLAAAVLVKCKHFRAGSGQRASATKGDSQPSEAES